MSSKVLKSVNFEPHNSVSVLAKSLGPILPRPPDDTENDHLSAENYVDTKALLAETQAHAKTMLDQAQRQISAWQEEARQKGYEAGYAEARQAVQSELAETANAICTVAQSAVDSRDKFLGDSRGEIGRLAVAIAEKIIGQELAMNPKGVTEIVAQAIKGASIRGACRIHVNPRDYDVLSPYWETIPSLQPSDRAWELVADEQVKRGGCLIEVGGGTIDARLETQLAQIEAGFEGIGE